MRAVQMPAIFSSPGQSEEQKERAVQLFGRFRVDAANNPPNAVAAERDQFVGPTDRAAMMASCR